MAYKHDYDKILTRLTIILARLNDGEALSVKALAEEFNVSERTIQRDFNERLVSFPVYQDKKKWKMQDGYRIEKSTNIEDVAVLNIMESLIEGGGTKFARKAHHLLSKIKNEEFNPIYAKLDMEDIGDKLSEVQQLERAIKNRFLIQCRYALDAAHHDLDLKPLKIANYEGFWYLIAQDARNDRIKKYYLKNLHNIQLKDEIFGANKELDALLENSISVWFEQNVAPYKVTLFIASEIAKYFRRKPISKSQMTASLHEDGSMVVTVEITNDMEIIPLVKYWIPHIKVIEPKRVKETIEKDIDAYLNR